MILVGIELVWNWSGWNWFRLELMGLKFIRVGINRVGINRVGIERGLEPCVSHFFLLVFSFITLQVSDVLLVEFLSLYSKLFWNVLIFVKWFLFFVFLYWNKLIKLFLQIFFYSLFLFFMDFNIPLVIQGFYFYFNFVLDNLVMGAFLSIDYWI